MHSSTQAAIDSALPSTRKIVAVGKSHGLPCSKGTGEGERSVVNALGLGRTTRRKTDGLFRLLTMKTTTGKMGAADFNGFSSAAWQSLRASIALAPQRRLTPPFKGGKHKH